MVRIVNAAFCHAYPLGSRFNGPERGAWHAAFEPETAQAEIAFHKWIELVEVGWTAEELTYDDYLADLSTEFHDIVRDKRFKDCLAPESCVASQGLAQDLLEAGSLGIVYPSVRPSEGDLPRVLSADARHERAEACYLCVTLGWRTGTPRSFP